MNPILWQPSQQRIENTNIKRFMTLVNAEYGLKICDYASLYQWSIENAAKFWSLLWDFSAIIAADKGQTIVTDEHCMPGAKWFPRARLNYAENLLLKGRKKHCALIFHNEQGQHSSLTYGQLYRQVSRLSQAMRQAGIGPGDRVAAVLPNIPEAIIAMLATTCIGAVWSSCSPDFGVSGVVDRFSQITPKLLFVCDGYIFNGKTYDRTEQIARINAAMPSVLKTIVVPYIRSPNNDSLLQVTLWSDFLQEFSEHKAIQFAALAFDDPLFILYSSGTTGPPKCIVHGVGGTLLQHLKEHCLHVDIHPGERLFYYTTCGWMMWNWLASALASAATLVLYDGSPLYPRNDVLFDLIDTYRIHVFGISAKYIDTIRKASLRPKTSHSLASLKTVLSTGSPLLPEGFDFVYAAVKSDLNLASISGGTDIISCFVLGCPILPVRRGEIQCRGLAMQVEVFDDNGRPLQGEKGELVCSAPFPSMPIGFWNDPQQRKYHAAYFEKYPGIWRHGDYVQLTAVGGMVIYGRSDTVLNPGGVRIGTAEIYRQVEQMDEVLESLAVGQDYQGDCRIILFVVLRNGMVLEEPLLTRIKQRIRQHASPRHVPKIIRQVSDIPRTKSGKIVEQALRNIIHGRPVNNRHALANPEVLRQFEEIAQQLDMTSANSM